MSVCVRCVTMPDRPHSVPGIRSFDAELTDRLSQLQQQEGRAYAEEHLYPPAANRSESHTQLAKLLQKCRKGEDGWPIAVISPAPLRATPSISQLPFWKSSVNFYPCASPAADAVSADSTAVNESEGEDAEVGLDAMEAQAKGTAAGNEVLKINCKQLNELAERIQQIAAWNNLSVQLTFSQLQTITPPSTPDPVHTQSNGLQLRIPSRQHSYDDADDSPVLELREQQEGHHKHFVSEAEEAEYDVDVDVAQCMPRAATPTVQIPAEISPTSSSGLASDPVSPSSSASRTPSTSLSFRAAASVVDHYAQLSSNFRQSLQDSEQCIPLLLEEIECQRLESVENQKRNEETIEALKQEVERLKAENDRLRNEKCVTEQSI